MSRHISSLWQYLVGFSLLFVSVMVSYVYVFSVAEKPYQQVAKQARELTRRYAGLTHIEHYSLYNGESSYISVIGSDKTGKKWAVLIEEESKKMYRYDLSEGISQSQAKQVARRYGAKKIDRVTLGYLDHQPVWEVKSHSRYYQIAYQTGKLVNKEGI